MSSNLSIATAAEGLGSDSGNSSNPYSPTRRQAEPAKTEEVPPPADPGQRLVIEEAEGELVYTVIDRASGAVVARTSRADVARMGTEPGYAAGTLIRAKA